MLKVAQLGRFVIAKPSVLPSASFAVGLNVYVLPSVTDVAGVPDSVGAVFAVPEVAAFTVIVNVGKETVFFPSHT